MLHLFLLFCIKFPNCIAYSSRFAQDNHSVITSTLINVIVFHLLQHHFPLSTTISFYNPNINIFVRVEHTRSLIGKPRVNCTSWSPPLWKHLSRITNQSRPPGTCQFCCTKVWQGNKPRVYFNCLKSDLSHFCVDVKLRASTHKL